MGVLFKEPLSSEACLGRVEAAAFHHTYLRAGNMKNGGGQGITESQHLMHALKRLDTKEGYFGRENAASYSFSAVKKKKKGGLRAYYSNPSAKKLKNRKGDWQILGNWGDRTNMDLQEAVKEVGSDSFNVLVQELIALGRKTHEFLEPGLNFDKNPFV